MKRNRLLMVVTGLIFCSSSFAKGPDDMVIYKWNNEGLLYYSHIKPTGVKDFIKLDPKGRKIIDYSDDYDEIVEIAVRPKENEVDDKKIEDTSGVAGGAEVAKEVEEERNAKLRKKNCETSKINMKTIDGGEVYETDAKGNKIRIPADQLEVKRKNVQKNMDFFCDPE